MCWRLSPLAYPHTGGIGPDLIDGLETGDKTEFIQRDRLEIEAIAIRGYIIITDGFTKGPLFRKKSKGVPGSNRDHSHCKFTTVCAGQVVDQLRVSLDLRFKKRSF